MTPEQDSKSEENCNLRSAKAGHSSNICLPSPNAPVVCLQTDMSVAISWSQSKPAFWLISIIFRRSSCRY